MTDRKNDRVTVISIIDNRSDCCGISLTVIFEDFASGLGEDLVRADPEYDNEDQ
jgi:hypothetical protein